MHQKYEYIQNIHRPRHCLMHQSDPSLLGTSCAQVMTRRHLCQKHRRWRPSVIEEVGKWLDKSSGLLGFIRQKITSSSTESKCSRISTRFLTVWTGPIYAIWRNFQPPKGWGKTGVRQGKSCRSFVNPFPFGLPVGSWDDGSHLWSPEYDFIVTLLHDLISCTWKPKKHPLLNGWKW